MKSLLSTIFLLCIAFTVNSQNEKALAAFDSIYYDTAVNVSATNPTKALHTADSLYLYSDMEIQRLRSLMLIADLLEKQGKRQLSVENALKALTIAENIKDYQWQAKIYGFLSTQYRNIGFLDQGKKYLKKGIAISSKIENKQLASQFRGMTYQEMAYYAFEENKFKEAIENVQLASLSFEGVQNEQFKNFLIGNNEEMFGRSYTGLEEYEIAKEHYYKSLEYLEKSGAINTQWGAMSFQGLGNIFLKQNKLDSAKIHLQSALSIAEKTDHTALKENVYRNMASYYKERKEIDSFSFYDNKYNTILQENISRTKKSINSEFNRISNKKKATSNPNLYAILAVIVLGVLALLFYFRRKIWKLESVDTKESDEKKSTKIVLPQKTEDELLEKLNEFEASKDYLDNKISFSVLVGQLNTNAKYLSHILKTSKNRDYNTYINELRIQYIVEKLKTDSDYLNYKISYLAEESGFSSHSKFSSNFKRFVNLSPSEYIESLRD
ncbi:DNA-binding domain-containing protein, AraC-type [Aequorivita sublithincola DSM 14238]|uniref:DNA-binding domain-containing protein, AraC-type n=1 Tax=Aequorivita sublithincola (strain DSM 14238 / LMG 21431 / ACAM 643 / 9-3) TaxID=746697 RepID=I3YTD2_AEQSU|nr:tetratricopeptide repeat protein [Aequorivita sublithincola]AFL80250.1 DNA-binding domain-containing protein, AraC-type [Aequorivita sublithincola DSM 14238]